MNITSTPEMRRRRQILTNNRQYQDGYDDGFERGTRTGIAVDRLYWCVVGIIFGALVTFLARTFT